MLQVKLKLPENLYEKKNNMIEFKYFKWYRPNKSSSCIYCYLGNTSGNGFLNGEWVENIPMKDINNWCEVEHCVVENLLRKEAIKRGLIPKTQYLVTNIYGTLSFIRTIPGGKLYFSSDVLHTGKTREIVFERGKWAEVINLYIP